MSNFLSLEKKTLVVAALCEGVGIRATARIVGIDRESVSKIGRDVGEGYARLHDRLFVERQNLTLRMLSRRWTRLCNGFSKVLRNHRAAFDLYVGYYNLCWIHEGVSEIGVKRTPAMAQGVTKEPWSVEKFTRECLALSGVSEPERIGSRMYEYNLRARVRNRGDL